jgi:hypothetical protein
MVKNNASSPSASSIPRNPRMYMGAHNDDDEGSLEAPRRARSEAQIAAFEKAGAERAANRAASAPAAPPPAPAAPPAAPAATPAAPAAPPPAPAPAALPPAPAPAAKPRKAQTDKGKKRGHLVRPGTAAAPHDEPENDEWYQPPRSGYANYVIVKCGSSYILIAGSGSPMGG